MKTSIRKGDWFLCGKVVTQASWDEFVKARADYWAKKDAEKKAQKPQANGIQPD